MAIGIRGTPQAGLIGNGGNVTLTFDVAPQEGDVVLVCGGHGVGVTTVTAPTGYTSIWENEGATPIGGAYYKVMGATPDTTVVCNGGGGAGDVSAWVAYVLTGVDPSNVLDAAAVTAGPTVAGGADCPEITTVTDGAWVFALAIKDTSDHVFDEPTGYSTVVRTGGNSANNMSVGSAYLEIATAAAEAPGTFLLWSSGTYFATTVAIRPYIAPVGGGGSGKTGPGLSFGSIGIGI